MQKSTVEELLETKRRLTEENERLRQAIIALNDRKIEQDRNMHNWEAEKMRYTTEIEGKMKKKKAT